MSEAIELEMLKRAFPEDPIDASRAFEEWGVTHLDAEKFSAAAQGKRWAELDAVFLEHHHDALVFLGPSSIADYLPAYLLAMLHNTKLTAWLPDTLLSILTRKDDGGRFDERFRRLTVHQRRAVAAALATYETNVDGTPQQADVSASLDSYWRAELSGGPMNKFMRPACGLCGR